VRSGHDAQIRRNGTFHSASRPEPGPAFTEEEASGPLPALLARLGIERCVSIGHSDGGSIEEETLDAIRAAGCVFASLDPNRR